MKVDPYKALLWAIAYGIVVYGLIGVIANV